jgi:hypothetical protein
VIPSKIISSGRPAAGPWSRTRYLYIFSFSRQVVSKVCAVPSIPNCTATCITVSADSVRIMLALDLDDDDERSAASVMASTASGAGIHPLSVFSS